jgi:Golgi phosphoprotein 3
MELSLRNRITCFKETAGRHLRKSYCDRYIEVIDDTPTGETLIDEALKIIKAEQSGTGGKPPNRQAITDWVDLLSGRTFPP